MSLILLIYRITLLITNYAKTKKTPVLKLKSTIYKWLDFGYRTWSPCSGTLFTYIESLYFSFVVSSYFTTLKLPKSSNKDM